MVKLGRSNVITIVIQVLTCWCLFKQSKGQSYTISESPLYAVKGESYRFTCTIADNIPVGIKFIRGSQDACTIILVGNNCDASVTDNRYQCTCNSNRQQLYINITDVTTADDAVWKCTDNQGVGSGNTVNLPVYFRPESVGLNPANIPPVIEGGDMTSVTCSAACKPTCLFTWSLRSSVISTSGGILHLTSINRTQDGMYTCQAKHPVLSTKLTTDLNVTVYYGPDSIQFKPDITSITVTEGDNPVITCSADCWPSCNIKWKSGNSEISSDGKLSLPNINGTQHEIYVCIVTNLQIPNSEKRKTLTVNYVAKTTAVCGGGATVGKPYVLTCNIEGTIGNGIKWFIQGDTDSIINCTDTQQCVSNNPKYDVSFSVHCINKQIFTITNVSKEDIGKTWTCVDGTTLPDQIPPNSTCTLKQDPCETMIIILNETIVNLKIGFGCGLAILLVIIVVLCIYIYKKKNECKQKEGADEKK